MIISTEFLDSHVRPINCIEAIIETTWETVHILGRNKETVETSEAEVSTPKQSVNKTTDNDKDAATRSAIEEAQEIHVHDDTGPDDGQCLVARPLSHRAEA